MWAKIKNFWESFIYGGSQSPPETEAKRAHVSYDVRVTPRKGSSFICNRALGERAAWERVYCVRRDGVAHQHVYYHPGDIARVSLIIHEIEEE